MASPIHTAVVGRRRTCPKCGHRQLVAVLLHLSAVTCRRCGAKIPPPAATAPRKLKP